MFVLWEIIKTDLPLRIARGFNSVGYYLRFWIINSSLIQNWIRKVHCRFKIQDRLKKKLNQNSVTCNHLVWIFSHVSDWHSITNSICNPAESLTKNQPFDIFRWCQDTWFAYCMLMACEHDYLKKLIQCKKKKSWKIFWLLGSSWQKSGLVPQ